MLKIENDVIYIVRGDDEALDVALSSEDGEFVMEETATLTLTVRKQPLASSELVFSSTSVPGSTRITIPHSATANAEYGAYSADIELTMANGQGKTVWPKIRTEISTKTKQLEKSFDNFVILPEVTIK